MALSKDKILKHAGTYKTQTVHVPAWVDEAGDDTVLVRGMTNREFELNMKGSDDGKATARVIARCVVDESGLKVFSDKDVDQIAELQNADLQPLSEAIAELSGLITGKKPDEQIDAAVADAEGNSEPTPSSDSVTS